MTDVEALEAQASALAERAELLAAEIQSLEAAANRWRANMRALLSKVGDPRVCRGPNCKANVYMVRHVSGAVGIYNLDGTSHWGTCVDRELFKKAKP